MVVNFKLSFFIFLALLFTGCNKPIKHEFSEIQQAEISNLQPFYMKFSQIDTTSGYEANAVLASLNGDYETALSQATLREPKPAGQDEARIKVQELLNNPKLSREAKIATQKLMDISGDFLPAEEIFAKARPVDAIEFITAKAQNYHFTLINEAHYSSQNRAFTRDLLMPLWNVGYRYLALEALGYDDDLNERGYPVKSTGYYINDSHFGNLIREALQIGYTLIPYETTGKQDGTVRDRDQAENIYRQTLGQDKVGKVLVHAGYGHISKAGGDNYQPMGYQLKKLAGQDILTIDQERMVGLTDAGKWNSYYREVVKVTGLSKPLVFLDKHGEAIKDPVAKHGIDIQVYHPLTIFKYGRPHWMKNSNLHEIPIPESIKEKYSGFLLQAGIRGEDVNAIPVDQVIITDEKVLLLPEGLYDLRIINREGDGVASLKLAIFEQ